MAASEKPEKAAYVYMVRCAGGQLYTGWTNDPEARLKAQYNQMYGNRDYYNLRSMYVSIANVIIVGGALAVINRGDRKTQA